VPGWLPTSYDPAGREFAMHWIRGIVLGIACLVLPADVSAQFFAQPGDVDHFADFEDDALGRRRYDPEEVPTPMQKAVALRRLQDVRTLLDEFPNSAKQRYISGPHPLVMAVQMGYPELVDLLLRHEADPNMRDTESGDSILNLAAVMGEPLIVQSLLEAGARVDFTTIHKAIDSNDATTLAILLQTRPDWGPRELGERLLTKAAVNGNPSIVRLLMARGYDVNLPPPGSDEDGSFLNPLQAGTYGENLPVVEALLTGSCTQEVLDAALLVSVNDGTGQIVRLLLRAGAKPDAETLAAAATLGDFQILRLLIDHGADPASIWQGRTQLEIAIEGGGFETLAFLLKMGARPPQELGEPPLSPEDRRDAEKVANRLVALNEAWDNFFTACGNGDLENVKACVLLKPEVTRRSSMVTVPAVNVGGEEAHVETTGLGAACVQGHLEVVKYLVGLESVDLEARCDLPGRPYSHTGTPLHIAVFSGNTDVVRVLLEAGANPLPDRFGIVDLTQWTNERLGADHAITGLIHEHQEKWKAWQVALGHALEAGDETLVRQLAKERDWSRARFAGGKRPLHLAVRTGSQPLVAWLVSQGADPLARDDAGLNALHHALQAGHEPLAQWLMEQPRMKDDLVRALWQADRDAVSKLVAGFDRWDELARPCQGYLPLHVAVLTGRAELVSVLVEAGADLNVRSQSGDTALDLAQRSVPEFRELQARFFGQAQTNKPRLDELVRVLVDAGGQSKTQAPPPMRDYFAKDRPVRVGGDLLKPGVQSVEVDISLFAMVHNDRGWRVREIEQLTPVGRVTFREDPREGVTWTVTPPRRLAPPRIYRSKAALQEAEFDESMDIGIHEINQLYSDIGSDMVLGGAMDSDSRTIRLGVNVSTGDTASGLPVTRVAAGSNAQRGGILAGDLITTFNGIQLSNTDELSELLGWQEPGDRILLSVKRGDETLELTVLMRED
jgi:ankyrin repeat protein